MNGRPRHWLNPNYRRSETESSSCRQEPPSPHSSHQTLPSSISLRTEARMKSILTCLPKSWAKLNNLTSSLTSILTSRSEPKDVKEVVMEGVLPTTKASLMSFLKGMGLRPKVELVGQETIISADMSVINDENLKRKFLDIIKMQVVDTPAVTNANSDTDTTSSSKRPSAPYNGQNNKHQGRRSRKSMDSLPPGPFKPDKPGECLPPGPFKTPKTAEADRKASREHPRTSIDSLPPGPFKPEKPNGTLPPGPFKTDKQLMQTARRTSKTTDPFSPGPFEPECKGDPLPPGPFKSRKTGGDLPPVPWAPKKSKQNDEHQPRQSEQENHSYFNKELQEPSFEGKNKRGVSFAMHQKPYKMPEINFWNDQPSDQLSTDNSPNVQGNKTSKKKKPKKLRIVKHMRRWILKTKKIATPCVSACNVVKNSEDSRTLRRSPSERSRQERGQIYHGGCELTQNSEQRSQVRQDKNLNDITGQGKQIGRAVADKKPLEAFDGSISMPVLITPDKSCFKTRRPMNQELIEGSKSSTRAGKPLEDEPTTYSVVGNSAAIHIAKNRIRLEGKDVKYGSILHKDKHFDEHFKVLQENSLQDIEYQVNKVKERIMFARAIDAVGGKLSEDAPEVNLKALLWPERKDKKGKTKRNQVDVVTKSSFYQKFLASMNILKCTNRTDACDRSVMTDEPLSRTYAEFIAATAAMSDRNRAGHKKKRNKVAKERPFNGERDATSIGGSSCDLPSGSYMSKICQCWEPLFPSKKEQTEQPYRRFEPYRTEDEKILKCVVNKVIDSSRNKKKGYIKTGITP